jgi:anti-anti-sigma factor
MRFAFWLLFPILHLAGVAQSVRQMLQPRGDPGPAGPVPPRGPARRRPEPALRLEIEVSEAEEGVVVRLRGEAGVVEAGALEAQLLPLLARRPARVTFDLSGLLFISSLALGTLVAYRRAAVRAGVWVCLAPELHPAVREAFDRVELRAFLEPGPSPERARKRYPDVRDVECARGVAWHRLVELEPQLGDLLWRARAAGVTCRTVPDVERAFGPLRNELAGLIGFAGKHHRHPVLGSVGAYEVAYWKLYDAVAGLVPAHSGQSARRGTGVEAGRAAG